MMSLEHRFEKYAMPPREGDACRMWTSGFGSTGTPNMFVSKKTTPRTISARKYAWERVHGAVPKARWVTMACGNKACVNVEHMTLRVVTDDPARFWSKVDKSAGPRACWPWKGRRNRRDYGVFAVGHHGNRQAHRVAYELVRGPIPEGLFVCHHCDNPPCCNPEHYFLGTDADNMADMWRKGRGSCGEKHRLATAAGLEKGRRVQAEKRQPAQHKSVDHTGGSK